MTVPVFLPAHVANNTEQAAETLARALRLDTEDDAYLDSLRFALAWADPVRLRELLLQRIDRALTP